MNNLIITSPFFQTDKMLREECESDDQLREQFKERWSRIPSAKLTEQFKINAKKYRTIIDNAISADKVFIKNFISFRQTNFINSFIHSLT